MKVKILLFSIFAVILSCLSFECVGIGEETYKVYCYLYDTQDETPITSPSLSINKSYVLHIYEYSSDEGFYLATPDVTLENYEFIGWSSIGKLDYTDEINILKGTVGDKKYIARWQGRKINVDFDSTGGSFVSSTQALYGTYLFDMPTPKREGYNFLGWYTQKDGGKKITCETKMPANDVIFYAQWEPINYLINLYSLHDDKKYLYKQINYNIESDDFTLPEITRDGYFFEGWTGYDLTEVTKEVIISKGSVGSREYYASWIADPCAEEHSYVDIITKATLTENGQITPTCENCGKTKKSTVIYYPKTITISEAEYVYNGKNKCPEVTVKTSKKVLLKEGVDYTVEYLNNKYVGESSVIITFIGNYSGKETKTFVINPKSTSISNIYSESKKLTVSWKKQSSQTTGYQLEYTWPATVATSKMVTVSDNTVTKKTIKKLTNGTEYYVRVRTYKNVDGKKYYSAWSDFKNIIVDSPKIDNTSVTLYRGQSKQVKLLYVAPSVKPEWKSTNNKIATVSSNGKITAKALGKTTITATYNGKTYKATINVTYMNPDFAAVLYKYNTRDNYFVVKLRNNNAKPITVLKKTTSVLDYQYKTFDRKVTPKNSVVIQPGETKSIKFYVNGTVTWPEVSDFTIYYYFKLDEKTYYAKADVIGISKYKDDNKKWKNTYQKKSWYEDFLCDIY